MAHPAYGGFQFDKEAHGVAPFNKLLGGRIVGGADEIAVGLAVERGISLPLLGRERASIEGMRLVAAYALEFDGASVDQHLATAHLHLAEAYASAHLCQGGDAT